MLADAQQDVVRLDAGLGGRPSRVDVGDLHAARRCREAAVGRYRHEGVVGTEPAAHDVAGGDQLVHHVGGGIHRDGEADAFGVRRLADQEGVDAHQLAQGRSRCKRSPNCLD